MRSHVKSKSECSGCVHARWPGLSASERVMREKEGAKVGERCVVVNA
jgi:hypothetical protein